MNLMGKRSPDSETTYFNYKESDNDTQKFKDLKIVSFSRKLTDMAFNYRFGD